MKRKQWLLVLLVVLIAPSISAQLRFGVKGGLNVSKVQFNTEVFNSENVTGFHVGPMLELMTPVAGLGVDVALLYSQKGVKVLGESYHSSYIEVPANLKLRIGLPLVKPFVAAGPYIGFKVGGDKFWELPVKEGSLTSTLKDQIETKNFSVGANFTVGAELFNKLQLGLTYSLGFSEKYSTIKPSDLTKLNAWKGKPSMLSLSATFMF